MGERFEPKPKAGEPLSRRGLAALVSRMARALETLDVDGGYVQWLNGVPRIFLDGGSDGGTPLPDGTEDYQVLRWDATAGAWIADWVRWP